MAGNITQEFRTHAAKQFKNGVSEGTDSLYFFYGRVWPNWDVLGFDVNNPPMPLRTPIEESFEPWQDMIGAKKITGSDATLAIRRNDWVGGTTVYSEWRHDNFVGGQAGVPRVTDFYVTRNNNVAFPQEDHIEVYKCIFNNGGVVSTISPTKPAGDVTKPFTTSDGYRWKFMYELSNDESKKWLLAKYVPARDRITVDPNKPSTPEQDQWDIQNAAVHGEIPWIAVTTAGANYRGSNGVTNTAVAQAISNTGSTSLVVNNTITGADDFYNNCAVRLTSGSSEGNVFLITDYVSSTKTLTLDRAVGILGTGAANGVEVGDTYEIGASLTFSVNVAVGVARNDGTGAVAFGTVNVGGNVSSVTVTSPGKNYALGVTAAIEGTFASGTNGSGAVANVYVGPAGGHGSNPAVELNAKNVIVRAQLINTEGGILTGANDYEQIGLVSKPLLAANGAEATGLVYKQSVDIVLTSTPSPQFAKDVLVVGETSNATARILEASGTSMQLISLSGTFQTSPPEKIKSAVDPLTNGTISSITSSEDLQKYSGSIVYVENIVKMSRTTNLTEDYKLVFEF